MLRTALGLACAALVIGCTSGAPAVRPAVHEVVVAPHGSDSAPGTVARPMRTVNAALRRLPAGGRVLLRGGTYHQRVRLVAVRDITVQPYRSEAVVLSGTGLTARPGLSALVEIADSAQVTVAGLELTGYRTRSLAAVPAGIWVHGHDEQVRLIGNHVHQLGNDNDTLGSFDINAHGIAAYGDDPHAPITGLTIDRNEVDHLRLGASESVVVNGNVTGWAIRENHIHDNDNIGIDAIGYEETISGRLRYTDTNRARDGVIIANTVSRIRSQGNPAYWEDGQWCNCADGIYVDGGTRIRVERNTVRDNDIGIEVAAENPRGSADHVRVTGNVITGSRFTGIATGGYCNGSEDCGGVETGSSHDNRFSANRLRGNNRLDDGSPELLVQYHSWGNTFSGNTIAVANRARAAYGTVPGDRQPPGRAPNTSDRNRFCVTTGSAHSMELGWRGHTYGSPAAYQAATGQDRHSTFSRCPA
jgi:hypothetical protein